MKNMMRYASLACGIFGFACAVSVNGALTPITYQLDGVSSASYNGLTLTFQAKGPTTVQLNPNATTYVPSFETVSYTEESAVVSAAYKTNTISHGLSLNGGAAKTETESFKVAQSGVLHKGLLSMFSSAPVTFTIPNVGTVTVTVNPTGFSGNYAAASSGTFSYGANFYFAPVPEPSTVVAGVGALGLVVAMVAFGSGGRRRSMLPPTV